MRKTEDGPNEIEGLGERDQKLVATGKAVGSLFEGLRITDPLNMELFGIIWSLAEIYGDWFPSKPSEAFFDELFKPIYRNESLQSDLAAVGDREFRNLVSAVGSCVYALKLGNTDDIKKRDRAWHNLLGAFVGYIRLSDAKKPSELSIFSKKGLAARHSENRAIKKDFLDWYAANKDKYPSMDAAAEYAAGKVVPMKFRTVRSWISQARKKQSPGKE